MRSHQWRSVRASEMITLLGQAKGHAFTIITICNYDEYRRPTKARAKDRAKPEANEEGQRRARSGPTKAN